MQRSRSIAAAPVRSAAEAWETLVKLLADTLERSSNVQAGEVAKELVALEGVGPAMAAAGHLENNPLVLVDEALYVSFTIATGDAALSVNENLDAVPGGASATGEWRVFVPSDTPLSAAAAKAVEGSSHVCVATAPSYEEADQHSASAGLLDLAALDKLDRN